MMSLGKELINRNKYSRNAAIKKQIVETNQEKKKQSGCGRNPTWDTNTNK